MTIAGRLPYWAILLILAALGLAGLVIPASLQWVWDRGVISGIGTALLVAAILGATIDRWMKTEIAANVFNATFGYVLPEEFQAEFRKMTSFRFMSDDCNIIYTLTALDPETVCIRMQAERKIINITNSPLEIQNFSHIDEWGFSAASSDIARCEIRDRDGHLLVDKHQPIHREDSTVFTQTDKVIVKPRDYVIFIADYNEIRRNNDDFHTVFMSPMKNPRITVNAPLNFAFSVDFGVLGEPIFGVSSISTTRILDGVYFPPGNMRFRWWPKQSAAVTETSC